MCIVFVCTYMNTCMYMCVFVCINSQGPGLPETKLCKVRGGSLLEVPSGEEVICVVGQR